MAGDRDLGVAFVRAVPQFAGGGRTGWEMTAATGVRGLRLMNETEAFAGFTFTEANPEAYRALAANVGRFPGALAVRGDARRMPTSAQFDYVDLDPYGSPVPFADTALRSVRPGGIVGITATDMMVLAGAQPSACVRRYGARPVRGRLGPEGGLRILLAFVAREARARGRSIRPLLAYARDHYVRAYLEVKEGTTEVLPVEEVEPANWAGPWLGDRGPFGPLWLGPLFDPSVVSELKAFEGASRPKETAGWIARLQEEAAVDRPFYFEPNVLAARLHLARPPSLRAVADGLRALGFKVARTHARPEGFRTDAPRATVEGLVRRLAPAA